jgi:hypothetical protein
MKITASFDIDLDQLRSCLEDAGSELNDLEDALIGEFGWVQASGIYLDSLRIEEEEELTYSPR